MKDRQRKFGRLSRRNRVLHESQHCLRVRQLARLPPGAALILGADNELDADRTSANAPAELLGATSRRLLAAHADRQRHRVRVNTSFGIENGEFVRVVVGSGFDQRPDERRFPGSASARNHDAAIMPASHRGVHEQNPFRPTCGLQPGVIAERVEEFLEIRGSVDQLTSALELEPALPVVPISDPPEVVDERVFTPAGLGPPQTTRSLHSGGEHATIGGAEAERRAEGRKIYHVRITSPSPALVP